MKPPARLTPEEWLSQCMRAARELSVDRSARADLLSGLSILSGLVYEAGTVSDIISREGIMDDIMRESSFGQLLIRQAREEGLRESIRDVLEIRFAVGAAHPLASRLEAIDDLHRLKQLHRAAIQVESLEEFRHLAEAGE